MLSQVVFNNEENNDFDDEIASINALADKILAANQSDEYEEVDEDEFDDEDDEDDEEIDFSEIVEVEAEQELPNNESNNEFKNEDISNIELDDKQAIDEAIQILNKKNKTI